MNSHSGLANLLLAFFPLLVMAPIAACTWLDSLQAGAGLAVATIITLLGFSSFAMAKGSRFGGGQWRTFGSAGMAPWARRSYLLGYACMAFGLVGLLFSVIFLH